MNDLMHLFRRLLNGPCKAQDIQAAELLIEESLEGLSNSVALPLFGETWRAGFGDLFLTPAENARAIMECAPLIQMEGIWLSRMGQPSVAHLPAQNRLFRIYCDLLGLDDPATSPSLLYRAGLLRHGISLPGMAELALGSKVSVWGGFTGIHPSTSSERTVSTDQSNKHDRWSHPALNFAALCLALSHRSRRYFPETLGFTLACFCEDRAGTPPKELEPQRALHLSIVRSLVEASPEQLPRIEHGWQLYVAGVMDVARAVAGSPPASPSLHVAMVDLIRSKLPHAVGYHRHVMLNGQSLDQWLESFSANPDAMLTVLHNSRFVNDPCPMGSRLLKAIEFGGPMFGVFSDKEYTLIQQWIATPHAASQPDTVTSSPSPLAGEGQGRGGDKKDLVSLIPSTTLCPEHVEGLVSTESDRKGSSQSKATTTRDLYRELLQAESPGDCVHTAGRHVRRILRFARWFQILFLRKGPAFHYSSEALGDFVLQYHANQLQRHAARRKSRQIEMAFLRWFIAQLAPAILVDGAWLAELPKWEEPLPHYARALLKIQLDEVGDGRCEWNHPNVYRKLLKSLELDLPDFTMQEFATSSEFVDSAFDIPAYLLAMGLTAHDHLPELLGLNLAIELSGLGADYLAAIDVLRHHQLDPAIVQLHLSIDNTASGHSALAVQAIESYLARISQLEGAGAVLRVWKRIWLGYDSLKTVGLRFAGRVVLKYWSGRARSFLLSRHRRSSPLKQRGG